MTWKTLKKSFFYISCFERRQKPRKYSLMQKNRSCFGRTYINYLVDVIFVLCLVKNLITQHIILHLRSHRRHSVTQWVDVYVAWSVYLFVVCVKNDEPIKMNHGADSCGPKNTIY